MECAVDREADLGTCLRNLRQKRLANDFETGYTGRWYLCLLITRVAYVVEGRACLARACTVFLL